MVNIAFTHLPRDFSLAYMFTYLFKAFVIFTLSTQLTNLRSVFRKTQPQPVGLNVHLQCIGLLTWRNMQPRVTAADRQVEIRIQHVALVHPVVLRVTRRQVCKVQIAWTKKHTSTREALI